MMISPEGYIMSLEHKSYAELIKTRNSLQREIKALEKDIFGEKEEIEVPIIMCPSAETRYSVSLEYMAGLCNLMQKKFTEEYAK